MAAMRAEINKLAKWYMPRVYVARAEMEKAMQDHMALHARTHQLHYVMRVA